MLTGAYCLVYFFFFSSRRRHTRSLRDWSSDVCSSDLERRTDGPLTHDPLREPGLELFWLGQRAPDLLRRVTQPASEPEPPPVAGGFQNPVHFKDLLCRAYGVVPSRPSRRGGARACRGCRSTARGTAPTTRQSREGCEAAAGTGAAARPPALPPGRPRAAPAGASRPLAGSRPARPPGRRPAARPRGEGRGFDAGSAPPAPRRPLPSRLICQIGYITVKSLTLARRGAAARR